MEDFALSCLSVLVRQRLTYLPPLRHQIFDSNEFAEIDKTPEEWIESKSFAQAPYYRDGTWIWRKVQVYARNHIQELV